VRPAAIALALLLAGCGLKPGPNPTILLPEVKVREVLPLVPNQCPVYPGTGIPQSGSSAICDTRKLTNT
jgi:hypothetical protein